MISSNIAEFILFERYLNIFDSSILTEEKEAWNDFFKKLFGSRRLSTRGDLRSIISLRWVIAHRSVSPSLRAMNARDSQSSTFSSATILIHSLRSKQLRHDFKHRNTHQSSLCRKRSNSWLEIMTIWDKRSRIIRRCTKPACASSGRRRMLWKSFDERFLIIETRRERSTSIFVSSSVLEGEMKSMWSYDERLCVRL